MNLQEISLSFSKDFESMIEDQKNISGISGENKCPNNGPKLERKDLEASLLQLSEDQLIMQRAKELAKKSHGHSGMSGTSGVSAMTGG